MAQLRPVLAITLLFIVSFGGCAHVILGDRLSLSLTEKCGASEEAELYRVDQRSARLVAVRKEGVWKPTEDYNDRIDQGFSFAFSRTVYTDTGLYELVCDNREHDITVIQLDVVVGCDAPATEGTAVTIPCYYITTGKHVDSIRWERNEETLLELNLSTGEISNGPGFDKRMSLSPDGYKDGNFSLTLDPALLEDEGDYFCSVLTKGEREDWGTPGAGRLKVTKKKTDQTTVHTLTPTQSVTEEKKIMGTPAIVFITAAVTFATVAPSFLVLGYWLKSRYFSHS